VSFGISVLFAFALTFSAAETGVTEDEIVIGSCYAFDGNLSKFGIEQIKGAEAFRRYINDRGGIHGRKLRFISYDDKDNADEAITCFRRLIFEGAFAAGFFAGSTPGVKHVTMAEANKIPLVGIFSGGAWVNEPPKRYVINVRTNFRDEARQMAEHIAADLHARKVGMIYENAPVGLILLNELRTALKAHGIDFAERGFPSHSLDVGPAMDAIRAEKPDVVALMGLYKPVTEILKRSEKAGWRPQFITPVKEDAMFAEAGTAAEGLISTRIFPPVDSNLQTMALYRKMLAKYVPEAKPNQVSLEGFIDAMVLVEGLKRAGKQPTREGLIDALESIHDWEIGLGPEYKITFGPNRHKALDRVYFIVVRKGKIETLNDWRSLQRNAPGK